VQKLADIPFQWDDIRYFLALAQEGSLSGAARKLKVEHSTVARRVEMLEQALAVRLFDRVPRGWTLTPEGETLAAQALRIDEEAQAFARAASGVSALSGVVRISAPPTLATYFFAPRLLPLRQRWPGITLELVGEVRQVNLSRREADLAIRLMRPTAPGLAARALGDMHFGLYARPEWLARPEEEWEFVGYDDSLRDSPQQQWLEQFTGRRNTVLRSNDLGILLEAAVAGVGVVLLPHFIGRCDPRLLPVPQHICPATRKLWLVMHPDLRRSPRVRTVADAIVEIVEREKPLLAGA